MREMQPQNDLYRDTQEVSSQGRQGDSMVGHLTPGDVIIPKEVAMQYPEFLVKLKKAMEEMGGDYRTHIAGSGYEHINPATGAPEFGFFSGIGDFFGDVASGIGDFIGNAGDFIGDAAKTLGPPLLGAAGGFALGGPLGAAAGATAGWGSVLGGGNGEKPPSVAPLQPPAFNPTRPAAMSRPTSLTGDFGSLDPLQERTALATRGTQGGGLGQDESNYYLNLLQRNIIDESGNVGDINSLQPVERQYLNSSGYSTNSGLDFLKSVQSKI